MKKAFPDGACVEQRAAHEAGFARFKHSGTGPVVNQRLEVAALHKDGSTFMAELSVAAFFDRNGYVAHAFMRDITARLAAQKKILDSEHHLRGITDNLPVVIAYIERQEQLLFANKTFGGWLGVDPKMAVQRPLRLLGTSLYADRPDMLKAALQGQRSSFESVLEQDDGSVRHLHTVYVPDAGPEDGQMVGIYALTTDVTAAKGVERHLEQLSRVDQLTGLSNRRSFEERLEQAMARSRRSKRPMALVFMDVDHFKRINDTHGHAAGDAVLKEFAARVQGAIRVTDMAARLGGDEFVVVVEGLNTVEEASVVSEKLVVGHPPAHGRKRPASPGDCEHGAGVLRGTRTRDTAPARKRSSPRQIGRSTGPRQPVGTLLWPRTSDRLGTMSRRNAGDLRPQASAAAQPRQAGEH